LHGEKSGTGQLLVVFDRPGLVFRQVTLFPGNRPFSGIYAVNGRIVLGQQNLRFPLLASIPAPKGTIVRRVFMECFQPFPGQLIVNAGNGDFKTSSRKILLLVANNFSPVNN
jgi:hypothetical protein